MCLELYVCVCLRESVPDDEPRVSDSRRSLDILRSKHRFFHRCPQTQCSWSVPQVLADRSYLLAEGILVCLYACLYVFYIWLDQHLLSSMHALSLSREGVCGCAGEWASWVSMLAPCTSVAAGYWFSIVSPEALPVCACGRAKYRIPASIIVRDTCYLPPSCLQ